MKRCIQLLVISLLTCFIWIGNFHVQAESTSVFVDDWTVIPYCQWDSCSLSWGIDLIKKADIKGLQTDVKFSVFIQDIVIYLLWFVSLIAVIYIIWAWFRVLTSWWDEEELKKAKKTIIYVIVWILIMWFAWTITTFIINLWDNSQKAAWKSWWAWDSNSSIIEDSSSATQLNYWNWARPNTIIQDAWRLWSTTAIWGSSVWGGTSERWDPAEDWDDSSEVWAWWASLDSNGNLVTGVVNVNNEVITFAEELTTSTTTELHITEEEYFTDRSSWNLANGYSASHTFIKCSERSNQDQCEPFFNEPFLCKWVSEENRCRGRNIF